MRLINDNVCRLDNLYAELETEINTTIKNRLESVIAKNESGDLDDKYLENIKFFIINTAKKNKKIITDYIDSIEQEINGINLFNDNISPLCTYSRYRCIATLNFGKRNINIHVSLL